MHQTHCHWDVQDTTPSMAWGALTLHHMRQTQCHRDVQDTTPSMAWGAPTLQHMHQTHCHWDVQDTIPPLAFNYMHLTIWFMNHGLFSCEYTVRMSCRTIHLDHHAT